MKKGWKRAIGVIVFVTLMIGVLYQADWIFRLKSPDGCYPMQMFYKQQAGTVDVLCLGSSHAYTDINPAVLWDEYGMASYDLASSNQPLWNSYYYFKEAMKYQTPKLVVLDVYRALEQEEYVDDIRTAMNLLGMRFSRDWLECLAVSTPDEETYMNYLLRFPVYHAKYQELKRTDFQAYNGDPNGENYKGFNLNCKMTMEFEELPDVSDVTEIGTMSEKAYEYLEKIILLARDEEIPLLLVNAPYIGITEEDKAVFNQVEQLAEEYGVPFIDYNEYFVEIGLDPATDFAESSHLNYEGNVKYSKFLADYICNNYEIPDHRGDVRYASWEENSKFYWRHVENTDIQKIQEMTLLFEKVFAAKERYTICVTLDGVYENEAYDINGFLADYGMDTSETGTWVLKGGEVVYTLPKELEGGSFYYEDLGQSSLTILTESRYSAMFEDYYVRKRICMEGVGVDVVPSGVNLLAYDNELQQVVVIAGMDATNDYAVVKY